MMAGSFLSALLKEKSPCLIRLSILAAAPSVLAWVPCWPHPAWRAAPSAATQPPPPPSRFPWLRSGRPRRGASPPHRAGGGGGARGRASAGRAGFGRGGSGGEFRAPTVIRTAIFAPRSTQPFIPKRVRPAGDGGERAYAARRRQLHARAALRTVGHPLSLRPRHPLPRQGRAREIG